MTATGSSYLLDEDNVSEAKHTSFPVHGHSTVTCLSLLPNGHIITASDDCTIGIHSPSGETIHYLEGHTGGVWCMDIYEDTLVTGSTDRTIQVWDMKTGRCTHVFAGHSSTVRALQVVRPELVDADAGRSGEVWPKKPLIISGSRDTDLRIWELPRPGGVEYHPDMDALTDDDDPASLVPDNPYHLHHLEGHEHAVRAIAARGRTCVSASYDQDLRVWDIITGECRWVLKGHTQKVYAVALDLPHHQAYSGSMDGNVRIWDLNTGTCTHVLQQHTSLVGLVTLTPAPAHAYLVSGSADASVCIWDPVSGALVHQFTPHRNCEHEHPHDNNLNTYSDAITALACDDRRVVCTSNHVLSVVDLKEGRVVDRTMWTAPGACSAVAFDDARLVACGAAAGDDATMVHVLKWDAGRE